MKSKRQRLKELKRCWKLRNFYVYRKCLKDIENNKYGNFVVNKLKYYNHWRKEFKADKVNINLLLKAHKFDTFEDFFENEFGLKPSWRIKNG